MAITEATRGHITVQVGEKSVTVWGEMLGRSPGLPDYQIYGHLIKSWDPPNDSELVTPEEKESIIREVCEYLKQLGRVPEVLLE
jgi:hypothetical protein